MSDREKIIQGFYRCYILDTACDDCPYAANGKECFEELKSDAFKLLKGPDDIVVCKNCRYYLASHGTCEKGHAHGYAETWFCADGKPIPQPGPDETVAIQEIIQDAKSISSRITCGNCGQELRRSTDLFCPHCGRRVMWELWESEGAE